MMVQFWWKCSITVCILSKKWSVFNFRAQPVCQVELHSWLPGLGGGNSRLVAFVWMLLNWFLGRAVVLERNIELFLLIISRFDWFCYFYASDPFQHPLDWTGVLQCGAASLQWPCRPKTNRAARNWDPHSATVAGCVADILFLCRLWNERTESWLDITAYSA